MTVQTKWDQKSSKTNDIKDTKTNKCNLQICYLMLSFIYNVVFCVPTIPRGSYLADVRCRLQPRSSAGTCRHLQISAQTEESKHGKHWEQRRDGIGGRKPQGRLVVFPVTLNLNDV